MKNVLMCKPDYFDVHYSINPWMKDKKVNKNLAVNQWIYYKKILEDMGVSVDLLDPKNNLPDLVFAADQAVTKNKKAILSNFRHKERRNETKIYKKWFEKNDYDLAHLPKNIYFEGGGESIWVGDKLLIGTGFRTSQDACKHVQKLLNSETECLELMNPNFYHLDTCLFVLNPNVCFYYPPAFSKKSTIKLNKIFPEAIEIKKNEAYNFAANNVVIGKNVVMQKGNNNIKTKIENLGYKTYEIDLSEFMKSGGGAHCLVQLLN